MNLSTANKLDVFARVVGNPKEPRLAVSGDLTTVTLRLNRWLSDRPENSTINIMIN